MRSVLVTGSAGFIGRHLVRHLVSAGYQVHGMDLYASGWKHPGFVEHVTDLLDRNALLALLSETRPDAVLHLAARTDLDETRDLSGYAANIEGVSNLADAVAATPSIRRTICTSSQLVCRMGYQPTHDQDYLPTTLYGESKVETERRWRAAGGGGRPWCFVRPTTIWGPGMNPHYLTFFRLVRDGRYFHVSGGPTPKSYGFVGNTVMQYRALLEAPNDTIQGRVFYLGDAPPVSLEEWTDAFRRALGASKIRTMPRSVAWSLARMGDLIQSIGVRRFPFTTFRLRNVITPSIANLEPTVAVCGPTSVPLDTGVDITARWLRRLWNGADRWEID